MYWKTYYYYIKTINRAEEVKQKKKPFNTGWKYQPVLKGLATWQAWQDPLTPVGITNRC